MEALFLVLGAGVVFAAGWAIARSRIDDRPVAAPAVIPERTPFIRDVLELHPTGVIVGSADGGVEYRNRAARALVGTHVGILIDEAVERHLAVARGGDESDEVLELFGPPKRVVMIAGQPLPDGRSVAFVDDVTAQRRADRARTDFVANVSHELRTPIGALLVLAETLVDVDDPELVARVAVRIQCEAERASRTIDDLLELSQIEAGRERDDVDVPMSQVVRGGVNRAGELAGRREIDIVIDVVGPAGTDLLVHGNAGQLVSAVGNVVENAVKYSERGATVTVRVDERDGDAEVSVIDGGVGIPRQDLDRVFERFYRVDRARSRDTGGTGLGLSIVRHIVENHGGSVTVTSAEGEGSTFVLRLPLAGRRAGSVADGERRHEEVR